MSAPAWESKLRRAAKRQGLTLHKGTPCGACWQLRDAEGKWLQRTGCLSPIQVAKRLDVDLTDWVFPTAEPESAGAPTIGTWWSSGESVIDNTGIVWNCTAGGNPGTWVRGDAA